MLSSIASVIDVDEAQIDEADDAPFVHRVRPASECAPPPPGIRSIFDLPGVSAEIILRQMAASLKKHGRTGHAAAFKVERIGDITRGSRLRLEEADEWKAREAARRARQTVPRSAAYKRSKGRKLRELIGDAA